MMRLNTINVIFLFVRQEMHNNDAAAPQGSKTYNHVVMASPVNMSSPMFSVTLFLSHVK